MQEKVEDHAQGTYERYTREMLKSKELSEENQKTLEEFLDHIKDLSFYTKHSYIIRLKEFSIFLNKPFKEATKEDVNAFLGLKRVRKRGKKEKDTPKIRTINGYVAVFKLFYAWLFAMPSHHFPECVDSLQKQKPERIIRNRYELPSKQEIRALLDATKDPRIKCYITMSLEGLYRRNEIRLMRIKDVIIKDKHAMAYSYETKTGNQNIKPLVFSKPFLVEWLNQHPFRNDKEAPLFVPFDNKKGYAKKFVGLNTFYSWLKKLESKTQSKKKLHPHIFRHVRTTLMLLGGKISKDTIRSLGGWKSDQMLNETYGHVEKEDHANAVLSSYGIIERDPSSEDVKVIKCMICSHPVSEFQDFCPNCRSIPTPEKAEEEQKKLLLHQKKNFQDDRQAALELLVEFLKDERKKEEMLKMVEKELEKK